VEVFTDSEMRKTAGGNLITVAGPDGERVDDGNTVVDDADRQHFWAALRPDLPNGRYVVSFQTLSDADGDLDHGQFAFYIGAGPTAEQQRLDATLRLTDTPLPTSQAPSQGTRTTPWPLIVAATAGAVIVVSALGGALWVLRPSR
jgi:hypothetical protein